MKTLRILSLPASLLLLAACSSGGEDTVTRSVSVDFSAEANNVPITCDTQLTGLGTQNTNAAVNDFRFYIHDLALLDAGGSTYTVSLEDSNWHFQNVALVDFTDKDSTCAGAAKDTHTRITGTVNATEATVFTGLRFTLGVPSDLNHADRASASSPLDITSLHWNWQNGYKHARLDVAPVGGISRPSDNSYSASSWNFHLGSTDCVGTPQLGEDVTCGRPNRPLITLNNFDWQSDTVLLDYGELVDNSNLTQDVGGAPGCMSGETDPECAALFNALGMDVSSGSMSGALTQTVFRVE